MKCFSLPGDSPMGFRLPIQSLLWAKRPAIESYRLRDRTVCRAAALPQYQRMRERHRGAERGSALIAAAGMERRRMGLRPERT